MQHPSDVGLPEKFTEWRKGQERALHRLLYDEQRFATLVIPVGGGKSPIYMGYTGVSDGRALVLTPTKVLMDQVYTDFHPMGLVDMRGRANYDCDIDPTKTADDAICTAGVYCPNMKRGPCEYYDQQRMAEQAQRVISNYKYWLHAGDNEEPIGLFDTLILDEAHRAPDEVADFIAVEVTEKDLKDFGIALPPKKCKGLTLWAQQAVDTLRALQEDPYLKFHQAKKVRHLAAALARMTRIADKNWVESWPEKHRGKAWRWDVIDPGALAEQLLFRGVSRVILSSATIRRKTLQLLNINPKQAVMIEQDSMFPVKRRPTYYWPVCSVGAKMTELGFIRLMEAIDTFVEARCDRNGVIHAVSYKFAEEIYRASRLKDTGLLMLHEPGVPGAEVVERFRERGKDEPTCLISPAVGEGLDFAYKQCEYQVIPKMPFPSMVSPLVRARASRDPTYIAYVTLQSLMQSIGRGMRAADDQCETLVLDKNFGWLKARHWDFCPQWFHNAVKTFDPDESPRYPHLALPLPPKPLEKGD